MAKSIGSAVISFGLVSVPVKFYTACASEAVSFNMLTPKGNRVKQKLVDSVTGEEVTHADCDKGYEVAKDEFVRITKDELKALEAECESKAVEILEFVPQESVDLLHVEKSYYLGPDKGGEKGYLLLAETMAEMKRVAVAQWNARGKEHLVVLQSYRGGLVIHQMYYATEIRDFDEIKVATKAPISDAEKSMARALLQTLTSDAFDQTKYKDHYVERVKKAIDDKVSGGVIKTATVETPKGGGVVDLAALLAKSLEQRQAKGGGAPAATPASAKGKGGK
jgi:DNA end-binding protein Ku